MIEPKINEALFDQAVAILAEQFQIETWQITKTSEGHFRRNFGDEVGEFFIRHSYSAGWRFGKNNFEQVRFLHGENFKPYNKEIYKQGYYIIGRGLGEDLIVLNCNTNTIGYIDSTAFYNATTVSIEDVFVDTHLDLGTFYYRSIVEDNNFMGRASDVAAYLSK